MNFKNIIAIIGLIFLPILCSANMIILPIFLLFMPTSWPVLGLFNFTVSLIESWVFQKLLFKEFKKSLKLSLIVNLITTVFGLVLISIFMIINYDFNNININLMFLLFFALSVIVEAYCLKFIVKIDKLIDFIIASFFANALSYLPIFALYQFSKALYLLYFLIVVLIIIFIKIIFDISKNKLPKINKKINTGKEINIPIKKTIVKPFTIIGIALVLIIVGGYSYHLVNKKQIELVEKTITPINGECGTANGTTVSIVPAPNLCNKGTASAVTGTGPWNWTCAGLNEGAVASCFAKHANTETDYLKNAFGATEIVSYEGPYTNPTKVIFWAMATCPGSARYAYPVPTGYTSQSCFRDYSLGTHGGCPDCIMVKMELVETKPFIKILAPNDSEELCMGEEIFIEWESQGIDAVGLHLLKNDLSNNITYNIGSFPATYNETGELGVGRMPWNVGYYLNDNKVKPDNNLYYSYKITISGYDADKNFVGSDTSDNFFSIIDCLP